MSKNKVLIIDDSVVIRNYIKEMMPAASNTEYIEAKDGLIGLKMILDIKPNLVFLDYLLPKLNGAEVYNSLIDQNRLKNMALVLMSGRKEEVLESLSEPFKDFSFLEKPFDKNSLHLAVKESFAKCKKRNQPVSLEDKVNYLLTQIKLLNEKIDLQQKQIHYLKSRI